MSQETEQSDEEKEETYEEQIGLPSITGTRQEPELPSIVGTHQEPIRMKPIALQSQRFWLLKRKVNEPVKPFKAGKVSKRSKIDEDPRKSHSPIRLETSVDTESEPGNTTATRFYNASPKFKDMPKRSSSVSKILPEPFQALMQDKAMKSSLVKKG